MVTDHPELDGTSTTVSLAVFNGTQIGVGHVGDSRGYLFRDGTLAQLTTDHTFVQSLIDEGRITEDDARTHPHRNLILRAVDGVHEPDPDVFTLDVAAGDRLFFCSDGAAGVLTSDQIGALLGTGTPDEAAAAVIHESLDAGSTDNVTVVIADVVDDSAADETPQVVGAAAGPLPKPRRRRLLETGEIPTVQPKSEPVDPETLRYAPRPPKRFVWLRRFGVLLVVAVLLWLIGTAAYAWTQTQYYVASDNDDVVIYQGVEAELPALTMHKVHQRTGIRLADLPAYNARQVREGIGAESLKDAQAIVARLKDVELPVPCPSTAKPTKKPAASAGATATKTPAPTAAPTKAPTKPATPSPTTTTTPAPSSCASPSTP